MNKELNDHAADKQRSDALYVATHLAGAVVLGVIARACLGRAVEKAFLG